MALLIGNISMALRSTLIASLGLLNEDKLISSTPGADSMWGYISEHMEDKEVK